MTSQLDQLVKGAPDPSTTTTRVAAAAASNPPSLNAATALLSHNHSHPPSSHPLARQNSHSTTTDPLLSTLPSSPPQIYLNLLILEASLRAQYLSLLARRRIHTFFLVVLLACLTYSTHLFFFRGREDGRGQGGSPYWVLDTLIKLFWLGAVLTALLTWATGLWERGMRWPRRWVGVTNRGLRGMNLKVVVLKAAWWRRAISQVFGPLLAVVYLLRPGSASVGSFQWMIWPERESKIDGGKFAYREGSVKVERGSGGQVVKEEDVAEGGDVLRLMLLPKAFSAEFREGWEKWRDEYWGKENARRADLREVVLRKEREKAKEQGGMFWWTGWRGWNRFFGGSGVPIPSTTTTTREKPLRQNSSRRSSATRDGSIPARKTSRTASIIHEDNNSRSSSRGATDTDSSRPRAGSATRAKRTSSSRIATVNSTTRQARSTRASTEEGDEDELGGDGDDSAVTKTRKEESDNNDREISPHSTERHPEPSTTTTTKIEKTPTSRLRQRASVSNLSDVSTASDSDFGSVRDGADGLGKGNDVK